MTNTIIHIDPDPILAVLDKRGWTKDSWEAEDGRVCAHQAIRLCSPQPGDAYLIERVAARQGWGVDWNDDDNTTEADVRALLSHGVDVTDADLAETFGPQWRAVVNLVRRAVVLTAYEAERLRAAQVAAQGVAWGAAWHAASGAASGTAQLAARDATWFAVQGPAPTRVAAMAAALAVVTWDLAIPDGPYTHAHRDTLIRPWRDAIGLPDGLVENQP